MSLADAVGSRLDYYVSSRTLYRSIRGVANPVANQVQELTFREIQPDLVEVSWSPEMRSSATHSRPGSSE